MSPVFYRLFEMCHMTWHCIEKLSMAVDNFRNLVMVFIVFGHTKRLHGSEPNSSPMPRIQARRHGYWSISTLLGLHLFSFAYRLTFLPIQGFDDLYFVRDVRNMSDRQRSSDHLWSVELMASTRWFPSFTPGPIPFSTLDDVPCTVASP